jgi:hypothetical protein
VWRNFDTAEGAEAPGCRKMRSAFGTEVGHWRVLPEGEEDSTRKYAGNRTGITFGGLC